MKSKQVGSPEETVSEVFNGAVVMIGGFGRSGVPERLTDAISESGVTGLTIISNNAGTGETGIARLLREGCVAKMICSYPRPAESGVFKEMFDAGKLALELVPQGTLAERIRCGGAGLGGFLTPTGVGTELAEGKQTMRIEGHDYLLEMPLRADFALVKAHTVDPWGNLTFRKAARNFNPIMAMASKRTLVQASQFVSLGALEPENVITPGVYVDRFCICS